MPNVKWQSNTAVAGAVSSNQRAAMARPRPRLASFRPWGQPWWPARNDLAKTPTPDLIRRHRVSGLASARHSSQGRDGVPYSGLLICSSHGLCQRRAGRQRGQRDVGRAPGPSLAASPAPLIGSSPFRSSGQGEAESLHFGPAVPQQGRDKAGPDLPSAWRHTLWALCQAESGSAESRLRRRGGETCGRLWLVTCRGGHVSPRGTSGF